MPTITPFLWFDNNAEEAVRFYTAVFADSKAGKVVQNNDATPGPAGSVMIAEFEICGQKFIALNGGPKYKFTEAISFVINCQTQQEIDHFWSRLTEGGQEIQCGWLKDRFGLCWQVVPTILPRLMAGDPARSGRVMQAICGMKKLDIETLTRAAEGT
jgi:predicted 3-demethylubiquinone-9 3-methyltransferase (glyoxalase superfamily)